MNEKNYKKDLPISLSFGKGVEFHPFLQPEYSPLELIAHYSALSGSCSQGRVKLPNEYKHLDYQLHTGSKIPKYLFNQLKSKFPEVDTSSNLIISGDIKIVKDKRFKGGYRMEIGENTQIIPAESLNEYSFMSQPLNETGLPSKIEEDKSNSFYQHSEGKEKTIKDLIKKL